MTFSDQTITDFIDDVAQGSATPGGGAVAALAGATGAALEEMVCNLTVDKEGYEDVAEELGDIADELTANRTRLLELADEDAAAFNEVMDAYQTPEGEGRAEAIEEASKLATEVPLETAEECLAVLQHARTVTEKGNRNAVTDGGTGALLTHAGLQAALYNVTVNLGTIEDEGFVADVGSRTAEIEAEAEAALEEVMATVEATH